jgi:hypothetical protein
MRATSRARSLTHLVESEPMFWVEIKGTSARLNLVPSPHVENGIIIPEQSRLTPSWTRANSSGSEEGLSSALRRWMCTGEAPHSKDCSLLISAPNP